MNGMGHAWTGVMFLLSESVSRDDVSFLAVMGVTCVVRCELNLEL